MCASSCSPRSSWAGWACNPCSRTIVEHSTGQGTCKAVSSSDSCLPWIAWMEGPSGRCKCPLAHGGLVRVSALDLRPEVISFRRRHHSGCINERWPWTASGYCYYMVGDVVGMVRRMLIASHCDRRAVRRFVNSNRSIRGMCERGGRRQ